MGWSRRNLTEHELDTIAWRFLGSEFTGLLYADWPIERRVDAFLARHGMGQLINDGDAYNAVLRYVLGNIGPALRNGVLTNTTWLTSVPHDKPAHDLACREDVEALLRRFYGRVFRDGLLAEPFAEIRARGLESHLPVMCDFWETVLFRAGLYRRNALDAHRRVHCWTPLSGEHFVRWLTLWNTTIDQMYQGTMAEHAKLQAARIATAMHRRLMGGDNPQLDTLAATLRKASHIERGARGTETLMRRTNRGMS